MSVPKSCIADKNFIAAVRALINLGYTQEYVAEVLHQSPTTIGNICTQFGIKRGKKAEDPEKVKREKIRAAMKAAYEDGCTDKEIAVKAQVSVEKVKSWRIRNGLEENRDFEPCPATNCKYHAKEYGEGCSFEHNCDYALMTGRTRTGQLTRKELRKYPCKLYKKGERERAKPEPIVLKGSTPRREHISKFNWEYAQSLWAKGFTDEKIAEEIGAAKTTVQKHRAMWGEANLKPPKGSKYDKDYARALFLIGRTNREIADELGAPIKTVQSWTHDWREDG